MNLFVFGTLRDPEIFEKVTGESPSIVKDDFALTGHKSFYVLNEYYPGLIKTADSSVSGSVLDVSVKQLEKLLKFEDPEDYDLKEVGVFNDGPLMVFMNKESLLLSKRPWNFSHFKKSSEKQSVLDCIEDWMA